MIGRWLSSIFGKRGSPQAVSRPDDTPPLQTMDDIEAMIVRGDLAPAGDLIRKRALPCLHVLADGAGSEALGATRFGGLPDLPDGTVWPSAGGERLMFLAQLDLADVARRGGPSALPAEGLLSIFAGDLQGAPETGAVAILTPPGTPLVRMQAPLTGGLEFTLLKPVAVRFEAGITLPYGDRFFDDAVEAAAPGGDMDTLADATFAKIVRDGPDKLIGQVLGHAASMAEDLYDWIAMHELGPPRKHNLLIWKSWEDWENAKKMESKLRNGTTYRPWREEDDDTVRWILANRDRIAAEAERWQVLLKVESNHPMNLWVNDADPVFVFIRTDDLKAGDFSRLRAVATQG